MSTNKCESGCGCASNASLPAEPIQPFDESAELPKLQEASLSWEDLDCVLADLDDFARITEIAGRKSSSAAPFAMTDIVEARDQFVQGALQGMQITYWFADQTWVDTLIRENSGARLLRILHQGDGFASS